MTTPSTPTSRSAPRLLGIFRRTLATTKIDPEYAIILVVAGVVGVLTLTDVIRSTQELIATTLGVLSLMAFSTLRQSQRRKLEIEKVDRLDSKIAGLSTNLDSVRALLESTQAILEVPGGQVRSDAFDAALIDPSLWHFRGCMGSYLRAETMRKVASAARRRAPTRSRMTVQILDPTDDQVCMTYANYRSRLDEQRQTGVATSWTPERVREGCLASLVAAIWFSQHTNLDIEVGLLNKMSTLRYDISDSVVLITNEDASFPALAVTKYSKLYHAIVADIESSLRNSRPVDLTKASKLPHQWSDITTNELKTSMVRLGLRVDLRRIDRESLLELAFGRHNRYSARDPTGPLDIRPT